MRFRKVPSILAIAVLWSCLSMLAVSCSSDSHNDEVKDTPKSADTNADRTDTVEKATSGRISFYEIHTEGDAMDDWPKIAVWCEGSTLFAVTEQDSEYGGDVSVVKNGCENGLPLTS